jgi:CheY-like chemotaxis protein
LNLTEIPNVKTDAKNIKRLILQACQIFVKFVESEDVLTIGSYIDGNYIFVDISRHRENFPPVERVVSFGNYIPVQNFPDWAQDELLKNLVKTLSIEVAFDKLSAQPSYISFRLPLSEKAVPGKQLITGKEVVPADRLTILAVDDQAIILDLLAAMCQSMDHKIFTARNGREGMELFHAHRPDIVISDLAMPVMSGWELASRIKKISQETPIIIITGYGSAVDQERMKQIGVDYILYKPFQLEQLSEIISKIKISRINR